jgi:class III poly(R)-hydroxyalkanoic acid synthase PhaE subunit
VAQAQYRKLEAALLAKLMAIQTKALDRLERIVRTRAKENRPIAEIRELYDLWIECGEEAYADLARSDEYCGLQAALGNANVQLRAQQQKILERGLKHFDLPTRAELNSVHRELRALRERLAELSAPHSRPSRSTENNARASGSARKRAAKRTRK